MSKSEWRWGEEAANTLSHGIGLVGAIAMAPILIVGALGRGTAADIVGASIFAASLILLYMASTLYHGVRPGRWKQLLRRFDHAAIFVLIAGTYTPFTLGVLRGGWGWALFGVIWGVAVVGIASKLVQGIRGRALSTALYVVMGWLVVVAIQPVLTRVPLPGVLWLVAGGLFYSAGVLFYTRPTRYAHAIWHVFVLAGSVCHVVSVLGWAV
jgi:hemolysin III